jgi:hypothetical protein
MRPSAEQGLALPAANPGLAGDLDVRDLANVGPVTLLARGEHLVAVRLAELFERVEAAREGRVAGDAVATVR